MKKTLTAVSRTSGLNRALKEGDVTLPDYDLQWEEVEPLPKAFRRMVREGAWDITEMAITTLIAARAQGVGLTAIPVFLTRDFHHRNMVMAPGADITTPRDLEGRRVGVARGYTVTTSVWARAILEQEHGVDLSRVTWARAGEEHVPDWPLPANVEDLGGTGTLEEQLARGVIPAATGIPATGALAPLIPDAFEAGRRAAKRGFWPLNHTVVIRDDVIAANPDLPAQLFRAFAEAKRPYLDRLRSGEVEPKGAEAAYLAVMEITGDPLPYGIAPNRAMIDMILDQSLSQNIVSRRLAVEELFAAATLDLHG